MSFSRLSSRFFVLFFGFGSLVWLLLRSGANPKRLVYPCQRAALLNSVGFVGYVLPLFGTQRQRSSLKFYALLQCFPLLAIAVVFTIGIRGSIVNLPLPAGVIDALPGWTTSAPISDVFVVHEVPVPICSLAGGVLPSEPPCNNPQYALRDEGIDRLFDLMAAYHTHLFQTRHHPDGILAKDDVVVIKVNNQWGGAGNLKGLGRLSTNTDVLKGLIWRILQHPDGFTGQIIIAENAQPVSTNDWDVTPANAEDQDQTYLDVVTVFQSLGYPVSLYDWSGLNDQRIDGGSIDDDGYPTGEYIHGNYDDVYILLDDPDGDANGELSYPKFQTSGGHYVSMRYGVWEDGSYNSQRLKLINLPVLKKHHMSGATIAWKNLIGFINADGYTNNRFGNFNTMHDYFFGYTGGPEQYYGLVGRQLALIRAPDLSIVDAIWVPFETNYQGNAVRQDILMASTDPFAVDWYASEHVLYAITGDQNTSAARGGTFRIATRINQNSALLMWPGGPGQYPYIELLDDYDGPVPKDAERHQFNVYVNFPHILDITTYIPLSIKNGR